MSAHLAPGAPRHPPVETLISAPEVPLTAEARVRLEIDLEKLRANFRAIQQAVYPLNVMAVLKANAYGLGVQPIARALKAAGASHFGVAELREALAVRDLGLPVLILGGLTDAEVPTTVAAGFRATISSLEGARALSAEAGRQDREVRCHLNVDTGMGRLGLRWEEAEEQIHRIAALPGLRLEGLYSHFPSAYEDYDFSVGQVHLVKALYARLLAQGLPLEYLHLANSDGINNIPAAIRPPFNLVRSGINLYGVFDQCGRQALHLQPVLRLTARLVSVRELPPEATIGYGQTFKLVRPMRIGTVAIGYADGLPLAMSNRGHLLIRGRVAPILGRVSMDYTTVSLDAVPEAEPGDEVVCLGDSISVEDWARHKQTIPYEIICSFGQRVERRCVG